MNFLPKSMDDTPVMIADEWTNQTTTVTAAKAYCFLGVLFDPRLRWKAQHKHTTQSVEAWINLVRRLTQSASGVSAGGMQQLYLEVVVPKITYAAEVWYTLPHKPKASSLKRTGSIAFTKSIQSAQ